MNEYMTKQQLDNLIDAYFDCRLSRQEEDELRAVLTTTTLSTSKINECRLEMGMEIHISTKSRSGHITKIWISIAASIAVLFAIGSIVFNYHPSDNNLPAEGSTIVYIAGKKIEDHTSAKRIAEKSLADNMAMMHEMLNDIRMQQSESKKEITEMLISE